MVEIGTRRGLFDLDLAGVWRYRTLLWFLMLRDVRVRYKQALLGFAWAVLQPLMSVVVFTTVFGILAQLPSDGVPYPLFALCALLPWTLFSEATRRSALGLVGDAPLISKIYFPRLVVPLANVLTPVVDFAMGMVVLVPIMAWYGVPPTINLLLLPALIVLTVMFGLSVGLWLGPINVRYRDITHTLPVMLQLWMYATPIVYSVSMIPERWHWLYNLNPMVGLIEAFRWSLLGQGELDMPAIATGMVITAALLVGGSAFFRRAERVFADIL